MKTRFLCTALALVLLLGQLSVCAHAFTDVNETDWFADSVNAVCDLGYMIGTPDGAFSPHTNITGAEAITMLARLHADTEGMTEALADHTEDTKPWYAGYINYCMSEGVLSDQSIDILNTSLELPLTRAELLYLFSELPERLFAEINAVDDGMIPAVDTNAYYASAVYRAYRAGITVGTDDKGTFNPDRPITRAEVAALIVRIADPTQRQRITLSFYVEKAINCMALNPTKTGYAVLDNMVERVLDKVTTADMTTYEKLLACYDYLVANCTYGRSPARQKYRAIYWDNPYTDPAPTLVTKAEAALVGDDGYYYFYQALQKHALEAYTAMYAAELLDSMQGLCDHYSSAFAIICRRIGVECFPIYINSKLGNEYLPHMATVMSIGGVDYIFDPQIEGVIMRNLGYNEHDRFARPLSETAHLYHDWGDLEECRALFDVFTYDTTKMNKINGK